MTLEEFIEALNTYIVNPLILLLFFIAGIVFLWGVVQFVRASDSDEARNTGKRHMLYGILGLFIMVSAVAIINIVVATVFEGS